MTSAYESSRRTNLEAYEADCDFYSLSTSSFDAFPGLQDELGRFLEAVDGPVLDLGCGGGRDTLAMTAQGVSVVALDLAMNFARRVSPLAPVVRADFASLPFADGSFGGIWACASLVHCPRAELSTVLGEVLRVLVPGGRVELSLREGEEEGTRHGKFNRLPRFFSEIPTAEACVVAEGAGLIVEEVIRPGRGKWYSLRCRRA